MNFRRINKNYKDGLWTKNMVHKACENNYITKDEYYYIVGEYFEDDKIL